jgi:hypothetical protein
VKIGNAEIEDTSPMENTPPLPEIAEVKSIVLLHKNLFGWL